MRTTRKEMVFWTICIGLPAAAADSQMPQTDDNLSL